MVPQVGQQSTQSRAAQDKPFVLGVPLVSTASAATSRDVGAMGGAAPERLRRDSMPPPPAHWDVPTRPEGLMGDGKSRGILEMAKCVIADAGMREMAITELRHDFYANSSRVAVGAKRRAVLTLAQTYLSSIGSSEGILPLRAHLVEAVAASLKRAHYKSGVSYLTELKMMQVEAGFPLEPWLCRMLHQVKSLESAGGPPSKAAEMRYDSVMGQTAIDLKPNSIVGAWSSWVVAVSWMLREIEVAGLTLGSVVVGATPSGLQYYGLRLPVSKNDLGGTGVTRHLYHQCSNDSVYKNLKSSDYCGCCQIDRQLERHRDMGSPALGSDKSHLVPLFPQRNGQYASKLSMLETWQAFVGRSHPKLGGHSARRTGAKFWARMGWGWMSIKSHSRWKSAIVLEYVEEAITEGLDHSAPDAIASRASSQVVVAPDAGDVSGLAPLSERISAVEAALRTHQEQVAPEVDSTVASLNARVPDPENLVPAYIDFAAGPGFVCSLASVGITVPSVAWRTSCGRSLCGGGSCFTICSELRAKALVDKGDRSACARCRIEWAAA